MAKAARLMLFRLITTQATVLEAAVLGHIQAVQGADLPTSTQILIQNILLLPVAVAVKAVLTNLLIVLLNLAVVRVLMALLVWLPQDTLMPDKVVLRTPVALVV